MRTTRKQQQNAGVTLIEMMVVIAIVAIVSSVVMFNYTKFTTNVSVRNLAQDIALSIRKAQTYATSVQALGSGSTDLYKTYGVVFSLAAPSTNIATPTKKRFIIFADVNENGKYDQQNQAVCGTPTATNECLEGYGISSADTITKICSSGISGTCTTDAGRTALLEFCRPAPDAAIYVNDDGVAGCANGVSYAEIVIQSAKGLEQRIQLWNTGQISVK
jgi:prepilin-type N-terminal cleavage/methylation domain-containing protein